MTDLQMALTLALAVLLILALTYETQHHGGSER